MRGLLVIVLLVATASADPTPRLLRPDGARLDAAAHAELAQARALLASTDGHERAGRIGSAYRAASRAYDMGVMLHDPIGFYRYRDPYREADLLAKRPQLLKDAEALWRLAQQRQLTLLHASFWSLDLTGLTYPSEITIELDGVALTRDEWRDRHPIDGGDHVWIARMDNFVFWRHQEHVPTSKGAIRIAPVFPFEAPPPPPPPPPKSQIAR